MAGALTLLFIWSAFKTNGTARRLDIWRASVFYCKSICWTRLLQLDAFKKMLAAMNINTTWAERYFLRE